VKIQDLDPNRRRPERAVVRAPEPAVKAVRLVLGPDRNLAHLSPTGTFSVLGCSGCHRDRGGQKGQEGEEISGQAALVVADGLLRSGGECGTIRLFWLIRQWRTSSARWPVAFLGRSCNDDARHYAIT